MTAKEHDPRDLDVELLRRAIYTVSVRHDWANTVDTEDRTQEIADEYRREVDQQRADKVRGQLQDIFGGGGLQS